MDDTLSSKVYDLLTQVVGDIGNFSVTIDDPNKKGEGFLSDMCFVTLRNKTTGKASSYVVKQAFTQAQLRAVAPIRDAFLNEINFYTKVWPGLNKFQEEALSGKPFDKIPLCLAVLDEEGSEKIVLENLRRQGFEMLDKRKSFDEEHLNFILKEYGKFHAISFAYRERNPSGYSELAATLRDNIAKMSQSNFSVAMKNIHKTALKALQPDKDSDVIEAFEAYVEHSADTYFNSNNYKGTARAILHGDCWSNNMMFKYNASRELIDMKLLDFQFTKDGTPVADLSYFLYSGGSKEIWDDLTHYLGVYHKSLADTLAGFGCDADVLYPFEVLLSDWKQYCNYGFSSGLLSLKGKLTYEDDIIDLTDFAENGEDFFTKFAENKFDEKAYNERARSLIVHMYVNGFL